MKEESRTFLGLKKGMKVEELEEIAYKIKSSFLDISSQQIQSGFKCPLEKYNIRVNTSLITENIDNIYAILDLKSAMCYLSTWLDYNGGWEKICCLITFLMYWECPEILNPSMCLLSYPLCYDKEWLFNNRYQSLTAEEMRIALTLLICGENINYEGGEYVL